MNRLLLPLILALAIMGGLVATLPTETAVAECSQVAVWSFDTNLAEWDISPATWTGDNGYTAPGALYLPYTGPGTHTYITLSAAQIAAALGLSAGAQISTTGISVSAAAINATAGGSQQAQMHLIRAGGGANSAYNAWSPDTWTVLQISATPGHALDSLMLVAFYGDVLFDDIEIIIPCSSINDPSPGATPTPTIAPTATITPTATPDPVTGMLPGAYLTVTGIIEPFPLAPIDDTIDLSVFWDISIYQDMLRIIVTYFYLQNIPQFFKVFFWVAAALVGIRMIFHVISTRAAANRQQQQQTGRGKV